jgi:mevalonate kinase
VVYGRPAIAVPVTQVHAKAFIFPEPYLPAGTISIQAPNINLSAMLHELPSGHPLASAVHNVLKELNVTDHPAFNLKVISTIPVAAGMGSGAAVSVAIIRVISSFLGQPLSNERVSELAFEIEKIHHGTPSGIDNTVITFQQPVFFVRDDLNGNVVETFHVAEPFTIVIADTGLASPTSESVGDVRRAWQSNPGRYEQIFDEIGEIVLAARVAIENGDIENLGSLMNRNHELLVEMEVSAPTLDQLIAVARSAGAVGAKLSGGGRGGNMIALTKHKNPASITSALNSAGVARIIITEIKNI